MKQQTPNDAAQFPEADPWLAHSLAVKQTPFSPAAVVHWLFERESKI